MPIYEYRCNDCQQIFEEWQTSFEEKELSCPICGGNSQRVMSNTSFVLKGTGWYTTDYCNKSTPASSGNGSGASSGTSASASGSDSSAAAPAKSDSSAAPSSKD